MKLFECIVGFGLACFQETVLLLYPCKVKNLSSFSVPVTFRTFMRKKKMTPSPQADLGMLYTISKQQVNFS